MIEGSCHCGAVRPSRCRRPGGPRQLQLLALSPHRRALGLLSAGRGRGQRSGRAARRLCPGRRDPDHLALRAVRLTTHWSPRDPSHERMGVNLRLFDPASGAIAARLVDGASW